MKKILVVDDEQDLCDILRFNLEADGYEVVTALSAEEAEQLIENSQLSGHPFDLLLLDVMLPGKSGFQLAEQLHGRAPVIFLTAKDGEDDVLNGFNLGADDYIAKPFSVKQVLARVKAVLHRTATEDHPSTLAPQPSSPAEIIISHDGLTLNTETKAVVIDNQHVELTKTEYALLSLLLTERGKVFSRQELLNQIWSGDVIVTERTVDVNITRLRKKIGRFAKNIATRQGFGYYFKA